MKRIYLLLIYVFCCGALWGQCPSGNITLSTQSQVDNFTSNYPNCTELLGYLWIEGSMTNLNGLSAIKSIDGGLYIRQSYYLTNLSGLNNLDSIGGPLYARFNDNLISFNGLNNLKYIGEYMLVQWNAELSSVNGFNSLTYIGGDMDFYKNPKLSSFAAFSNLTTIDGRVEIEYNSSLPSLSGLDNITQVGYFRINNNPNLSECDIESVCSHLAFTNVASNSQGCNSTAEIATACIGTPQPCLPDGIIFTSQQQIDSFAINYPNCQQIDGDVMIKGDTPTSITSLAGLFLVQQINGKLTIQDNTALNNIGLALLSTVNGLEINNIGATYFSPLNITHINGELIIRNNPSLGDLYGLKHITPETIHDLQIYGNPNLEYCDIMPICEYIGFDVFDPYNPTTSNPTLIANNDFGCNSPVEITQNGGCFALPIELTHFQAQIQHKTALLTWQTATETHNEGFEIQRSKDAATWEKIAWQDGQGDSQTSHDYTYRDENPLSGTSYYRLKQIDFGGTFSYSDVVEVEYVSNGISIYPNPVKNTLHITDLNGSTVQNTTIFDQMGRQIILQNTGAQSLDVSTLSSGVYIIKVTLDSGVFSDRFIVK